MHFFSRQRGTGRVFSLLLWLLFGHWLLFLFLSICDSLLLVVFSHFLSYLNDDFSMQVENSFLNEINDVCFP